MGSHRRRRAVPRATVFALLATVALVGHPTMPDALRLAPGRYVVDALEHPDLATLEGPDGGTLAVPRAWLPMGVREGDVLTTLPTQGASADGVRFAVDAEATEERRRTLQERRDALPSAPSGDLEL